MPQVIIAAVFIALAVAEAGVLIYAVAIAAVYYYMKSQESNPNVPSLAKKNQTTTVRSAIASHKIVYGETQVGGVLVYLNSSGTKNDYAHMVVVLAPHEVESIDDIWFDDKLSSAYNSSYWRVKKHLGSVDQLADSDLISECAGLNSSFRLRGLAYVYVRFKYDLDVWPNGLPRNIRCIVKGKKLYDPRDVAQSPTDPATWLWSSNWGLVMRDFITGSYGMGALPTEIDDDNIAAAANISDEPVINYDGSYQPRYTVNGTVDTADSLAVNRDSLAEAGGGYAAWVEGKVKLVPGVYTPPVSRVLTDDDLRDTLTISPRTPRQDLYNAVKGVYMGPITNYQITEFPPVTNSFYESQDGGEQIWSDVEFPYCDNPDLAQRLAKLRLDRVRQPITVSFPGKWTCFYYTVGDTVTLTLNAGRSTPIWDAKEFKIIQWGIAADGAGIDLVLKEETAEAYDWNQGDPVSYDASPDINLPSIFAPPPNVVNVEVTEETYSYRLRSFTRLTVNFDPPPEYPYFSHIEVQHSTDGVNFKQLADQKSSFTIDPVSEGEKHWLRLKSVSVAGVRTEDSQAYLLSTTVVGHSAPPAALSALYAIVNSQTINLYSAKVADPDVEVYEFRVGPFASGIFLASLRSPNLSLFGVKPGNYTFSANTLSNNGLYGTSPQQAFASLSEPPGGWTVVASASYDYSTGTHTNTEAFTYNALPHLKCSHELTQASLGDPFLTEDGLATTVSEDGIYGLTSEGALVPILTGTYTTPIYDVGSVAERLFYALADILVIGTGTTWNSKFGASLAWDQLGLDEKSWREIFELSEAPVVKMVLLYGETSPPPFRAEKMEILSTVVTGRYFQLEIEITDPISGMNALVEEVQLKFATRV